MENNKERKIKITSKYFQRAWENVIFPEIRLTGKWLQDAGFICGQFVTITQQGSSITITALPAAQEQQTVKKASRKKDSFLSPDLASLPINQLFRQWPAVEFHEYMDKVYKKKKKPHRWRVSKERAWEEFKKERRKTSQSANSNNDKSIIQIHPAVNQVADITVAE